MSNYTQSTNFATKDALSPGDPLKIVRGTEINTEFANIAVAVATKLDTTALAAPGPIGATTPSTINATTGTFSGNVQMASLNGGAVSLRNKIINGNMGIFQRGTAAVTTDTSYGPADRWRLGLVGNTTSVTQGAFASGDTLYDTGGAQYFTQAVVTSVVGANNYSIITQRIEDVRLLAGQTVTVSFWAKVASGTPSIGLGFRQVFGSGGSPSAAVQSTGQAQALTTTWAQYNKTFTLSSINGKTIGTTANTSYTEVYFYLDAGSSVNTESGSIGQASKTVSIAQVQLEVGPVATPFEQRPIGMELALCQRYFQSVGVQVANGANAANVQFSANWPVQMRATPTTTVSTGTAPTVSSTNWVVSLTPSTSTVITSIAAEL